MDKEIRLITVRNEFDRNDKEIQLVSYDNKSLLDLRNEYLPSDVYFSAAVNGQVIPEDQLALCIPQEGDCVVFTPKIGYVSTAAAAIAAAVAASVGSAVAVSTLAVLVYCAVFALVYIAGIALIMGIGMLVSSLFAPSVDDVGTGDAGSQLYSWSPATKHQQGGSVPKMYGLSKVYGNIISTYTETVGDKMYINLLISVNLGPLKSITGFKINDQDGSIFDGVTFDVRKGYIDQPVIYGFDDTKNEYNMQRLVKYGATEEYTTLATDFDEIEVEVSFLKGLYAMNSSGDVGNLNVRLRIEAISLDDPSVIVLLTHDIYAVKQYVAAIPGAEYAHWELGRWSTSQVYVDPMVDIINGGWQTYTSWSCYQLGGTDPSEHTEGESEWITTTYYSEVSWTGTELYTWHWIPAAVPAHYITVPDWTNYATCSASTTDRYSESFRAAVPFKGGYKIRVTRLTEDISDATKGSEMSLTAVRLIYHDDFSYPRHAMVGIKALASDQLSGSLGFSCMVEGSLIRVYDGTKWNVQYSNNPAWVCYDILTQPVFNDPSIVYREGTTWDYKFYRCKLSHTANGSNHPEGPTGSTYWEVVEGRYQTKCEWDTTFPDWFQEWGDTEWCYDGSCRRHGTPSVGYRCIVSHEINASNEPGVGANWQDYWVVYLNALEFFIGDFVVKVGSRARYRCIQGHMWSISKEPGTSGGAAYWQSMAYQSWVGDERATYVDINDSGIARYDGIDPSRLDYLAFKAWADFCDVTVGDGAGGTEKRFEFNGGFDSEFSLWEAALRVCQMSRAMLYWNGNQISVVIDQAGTPVQLFTSGNVIADSFEEAFLPYEDRAGEIEISFINKDVDYTRDTFTIFNTTLDKPTNKAGLQLLGVTKPSQAWRTGQFLLLCNQYLKRTIKFKADIDAIACTIGDVINFQHDVPKWGLAGGRVVSATANSVTIDTEVTIEAGHSYSIMIRLNTDVLVTKTVTNAPGTYSTLTVSTPFTSVPVLYDVYSFGEAGVVTKPFRVQAVEKAENQIISISCLEYNANVYSVDTGDPILPDTDYTPEDMISPVTDLSLKEMVYFDKSGNMVREVRVSFVKPNNILYKEAIIYYSKNGGSLVQAGVTQNTQFTISGGAPLDIYFVYVCSRSWSGLTLSQGQWPSAIITLSTNAPDIIYITDYIVSGLEIYNQGNNHEFTGKDCKFAWRPISAIIETDVGAGEEDQGAGNLMPGIWFLDYEVQIYSTSGTLRRTEYTVSNEYTYTYEKNCEDSTDGIALYTFEIRVKARDTLGHISATAATLIVTNSLPNPVVNLSALPVISGVCFTWNKNTDSDFDCYYVRTSVALVFGDWKKVTDNAHTRSLTDAEMTAAGADALITIEVQAMDVFGQVSTTETVADNAATISDNLFQFLATKSGGTGNVSDLYDGARSSGGLVI